MIVLAVVYVVAAVLLLRAIDRRMKSTQAAREAAFLRRGIDA
jgi:hypothetical protein